MFYRLLALLILAFLLQACGKTREEELKAEHDKGAELVENKAAVVQGVGDALKKNGSTAAESLSEGLGSVVKGVAGGVDKVESSFAISVHADAAAKKLSANRIVMSDKSGTAKAVKVYVLSAEAYKGKLQLRALDGKGVEIGRSSKVDSDLGKDDAAYVEFEFDEATPFSRVNKFVLHVL